MLFADSVDDSSASLTCRTYLADLGSGTRTISAVSMFMIHLISARKACERFSVASVAASLGTCFFTSWQIATSRIPLHKCQVF
jgi:hypothetical protein